MLIAAAEDRYLGFLKIVMITTSFKDPWGIKQVELYHLIQGGSQR